MISNRSSSHPDQGVTVTLRPVIPISLRETPNALKLRVFERSGAQKHVESGGGVTCNLLTMILTTVRLYFLIFNN